MKLSAIYLWKSVEKRIKSIQLSLWKAIQVNKKYSPYGFLNQHIGEFSSK